MRKILHTFVDITVFSLAAIGSLMAFGMGAAWALARSAASRKNPIALAAPAAGRTRSALAFIYAHSGLPGAAKRTRTWLRQRKKTDGKS